MEFNISQQYLKLQQRMQNSCTPSEVQQARNEAFAKGWLNLVQEGRQILLFSFGYTKAKDGTLNPPLN